MGRRQYEKAAVCFTKALNLQPEQLYVSRAEAYLQLCDFQSAAASYKRAWILQPGAFSRRLAFIYYLQGQCLFDGGLFLEALEAFSKAAEVKPDCRVYQVRSLACLTAAGRHSDCLKLLDGWMTSGSPTAELHVLRARLVFSSVQTSRCHQDVTAALALDPSCLAARVLLQQLREASEEARLEAVDRTVSGRLPEALCMINVALESSPQDARLYLCGDCWGGGGVVVVQSGVTGGGKNQAESRSGAPGRSWLAWFWSSVLSWTSTAHRPTQ
uniref:Tetratricopeptide repeat domain 16 n=1 Tax=Stegastes partitus TaxID=144197 RepID=A0A3B5AL98_9TELE